MDNHFVPNLTFGPTMVEALARSTDLPLDAHLMIEDADRHAPAYVEAGCGVGHLPRRGGRGPGAAGARDPGQGRAGEHGAQAGHRRRPLRGPAPRARHAAADDRRARVRRPEVPRPGAAQDPPRPRARRRSTASRPGSRSTAASRSRPSSAAPRPAPTSSWPAAPSTPPTTPTPWSPPCASGPPRLVARVTSVARRPAPDVRREPSWRPRSGRPGRGAVTETTREAGRDMWQAGPDEQTSSRALGSVKFRAGGDSPRPDGSQPSVDQVKVLDRR